MKKTISPQVVRKNVFLNLVIALLIYLMVVILIVFGITKMFIIIGVNAVVFVMAVCLMLLAYCFVVIGYSSYESFMSDCFQLRAILTVVDNNLNINIDGKYLAVQSNEVINILERKMKLTLVWKHENDILNFDLEYKLWNKDDMELIKGVADTKVVSNIAEVGEIARKYHIDNIFNKNRLHKQWKNLSV